VDSADVGLVVLVGADAAAPRGITTVSADILVALWIITITFAKGEVSPESQDWTVGVMEMGIENDAPLTGSDARGTNCTDDPADIPDRSGMPITRAVPDPAANVGS